MDAGKRVRVSRIRHRALEAVGEILEPGALSERLRLSLLAQGGGLLAFLHACGWHLAEGWATARVSGGRLVGLRAAAGGEAHPMLQLVCWTERLFGSTKPLGRSRVRRIVRELSERWLSVPVGWMVSDWLLDLLRRAPELEREEAVQEALHGELKRGAQWIRWSLRGEEPGTVLRPGPPLMAKARVDPAALAGIQSDASRFEHAERLERCGRFEAALAALVGERSKRAEMLRFRIQRQLGLLGPARQTLRRLEEHGLQPLERLEITDEVLRLWAAFGERESARSWVALLVRDCRGPARVAAELYAVLARLDAGEVSGLEERIEQLKARAAQSSFTHRLWLEVASELAFASGRGEKLAELSALLLQNYRRNMSWVQAGRTWNRLGLGRDLLGNLEAAERAYHRAMRLLARADGPLRITLAASNWAEVRLRRGLVEGVEPILLASEQENLRAGNAVGLLHDRLLRVRLQLVRGELELAVRDAKRVLEEATRIGARAAAETSSVLGARASAWLGNDEVGRDLLKHASLNWPMELEPEEVPFLRAQLRLSPVEDPRPFAEPARALVHCLERGESPPDSLLAWLSALEPYRRARVALDAECVLPGALPISLREEAQGVFERLGAVSLAASFRPSEEVAWEALASYLQEEQRGGTGLEVLFKATGHGSARVIWRLPKGERWIFDGGVDLKTARTLILKAGSGELQLQSARVDGRLKVIGALLARELEKQREGWNEQKGSSPFVGKSRLLLAALERLSRFAASEMPILLLGENGTGKELAARYVHDFSPRRHKTFVPFNCAGLTETLQHSELFGHVRGAFTGADRARAGVFEQAHGGTLFLDEIGDLPLSAQGAILRALQEGEIRRVGESLPRRVDVRLIAATHRDLERMVEEERFRQDLFYRLKVAVVRLPPLRERPEDIPLLAEAFLSEMRRHLPGLSLSPRAKRLLVEHDWPGNVRELRHALEAAAVLAGGGVIEPRHLDLERAPEPKETQSAYHVALEEFRKRLLQEALAAAKGNCAAAARQLGISRQNFSYLARRLRILPQRLEAAMVQPR